jgi:hypothetical protein
LRYVLLPFFHAFAVTVYHYSGLAYYFSFKSDKVLGKKAKPNAFLMLKPSGFENMREKVSV